MIQTDNDAADDPTSSLKHAPTEGLPPGESRIFPSLLETVGHAKEATVDEPQPSHPRQPRTPKRAKQPDQTPDIQPPSEAEPQHLSASAVAARPVRGHAEAVRRNYQGGTLEGTKAAARLLEVSHLIIHPSAGDACPSGLRLSAPPSGRSDLSPNDLLSLSREYQSDLLHRPQHLQASFWHLIAAAPKRTVWRTTRISTMTA